MRIAPIVSTLVAAMAATPSMASPSDSSTATLAVSAVVASRTSLRVSTGLLRFDVGVASEPAIAVVEVSAASRTREGGEVVLSIDPVRVRSAASSHDEGAALTFAGEGDGLTAGTLGTSAPAIAGRWIGSGKRTGRLFFVLRNARAGTHVVPVRFVLSTP